MLQKLVYTKIPPDDEGKVTTENILNLQKPPKKKKKSKKDKNDPSLKIDEDEDTLTFESKFESGNLQLAYKTAPNQYQLFLHHDTNTKGHSQWFFYRVTNTKKGIKNTFSIMNLLRKRSKYCYGITIWYYSVKKNSLEKKGWQHTNENVKYCKNKLYRIIKGNRQYFYTLTFDYTSEYDDDEVYFANCIPYTYTDLMTQLNDYEKYNNTKYPFLVRKTLCTTLAGNDLDYLILNNTNYTLKERNDKEGVVLFARQHPSETVGSWVILGAIEFLLGNSDEARYLRDNFIFKIIPMMNPDGVICGNTRTSIAGCDLNRRWIEPDELIHPEIFYAKEMIVRFANQRNINCIIDFHAHFGAFNSFFYANKQKEFELCRMLPFTCAKKSKVISFEKSRFSMPKYKKGTGRIDLYNELEIENILAIETSYFGCISGIYKNQYFTPHILKQIGVDICLGILLNHYNMKNKMGISNLNDYPELKEILPKEAKEIEIAFQAYCERAAKVKEEEEKKEKEIENKKEEKMKRENKLNLNEEVKVDEVDELDEEDSDNPEMDDEDSESDPSLENLEEEVIKKLLPSELKRNFKRKKSKLKHVRRNKNNLRRPFNKNPILEPPQSPPLNQTQKPLPKIPITPNQSKPERPHKFKKEAKSTIDLQPFISPILKSPKKSTGNLNVNMKSEKIVINCSGVNNYINSEPSNKEHMSLVPQENQINKTPILEKKEKENEVCLVLKVSVETQTEEIYFKMHWSFFLGTCHILGPSITVETNRSIWLKNPAKNYYMQGFINYGIKKKLKSQRIPAMQSIADLKHNKNNSNNRQNNNMRRFNSLIKSYNNNNKFIIGQHNLKIDMNIYSLSREPYC